jgi:hypothetical protein
MVILRPHGFFRRYHILLCKFESDVCIVLCRYSARACVEGLMVHNIIKIVRMRTDRGGLQKCVTVTGGGEGLWRRVGQLWLGGGGQKSRKKVWRNLWTYACTYIKCMCIWWYLHLFRNKPTPWSNNSMKAWVSNRTNRSLLHYPS